MTATRKDLAKVISEGASISLERAGEYVDHFFEIMVGTLERGEKIKISGFGIFKLRQKRERIGRNPKTSQPMRITARPVVNFKSSPRLRKAMSKGDQ